MDIENYCICNFLGERIFRKEVTEQNSRIENEDYFVANNKTFIGQDTLLHDPDVNVSEIINPYLAASSDVKSIAPGEGNLHLPYLQDENNEELSFIKIYGGKQAIPYLNNKRISYSAVCKSEVRRYDRRVAESIPKLFYMSKKLLAKNMLAAISTTLSKTKNTDKLTASDALDKKKMNELLISSEANLMMRSCRSSPQFWQLKNMEINAMIRQLGCPTFFLTFSPAEKDWLELLVIVKWTLDREYIEYEDAALMSLEDRRNLLSRDPVTVARYFENRMLALFRLIFNENTVFEENPLKDYFWRVDFQYAGSPHIHMLAWMKNSPTYNPDIVDSREIEENRLECRAFIDKYITCERPLNDELIDNYNRGKPFSLRYQFHRHMPNCRLIDTDGKCLF